MQNKMLIKTIKKEDIGYLILLIDIINHGIKEENIDQKNNRLIIMKNLVKHQKIQNQNILTN